MTKMPEMSGRKTIISDNNIYRLPDGRRLGYAVYGAPQGQPILFFHGIPGSRLQRPTDLSFLLHYNYRVFALDRPGIGLSTSSTNRSLESWSADVQCFCRSMDLRPIFLLGVSGGGPYALRCGLDFAAHCTAVILISSLAPLSEKVLWRQLSPRLRLLFVSAKRWPWLTRRVLDGILQLSAGQPDKIFTYLDIPLPAKDGKLLGQAAIAKALNRDLAEALRQGSHALVAELEIQTRPWGFSLSEVQVPVQLWHGTADTLVPPAMASYLASHLPHATLNWVPGGGHFIALEMASKALKAYAEQYPPDLAPPFPQRSKTSL